MSFSDKIAKLSAQTDALQKEIMNKEKCVPTLIIVGVATPIIWFIVLYMLQPGFVQVKEGDKYVRSNRRVVNWTLILTILVWISLYLYTFCNGYKGSAICKK